jgi:hypothetical protein
LSLSTVEVDLIFSKITGPKLSAEDRERIASEKKSSGFYSATQPKSERSFQGRMEFNQFLEGLELIGEKLFLKQREGSFEGDLPVDSREEWVLMVIENYILKLENYSTSQRNINNIHILQLINLLKQDEMVTLFKHPLIFID